MKARMKGFYFFKVSFAAEHRFEFLLKQKAESLSDAWLYLDRCFEKRRTMNRIESPNRPSIEISLNTVNHLDRQHASGSVNGFKETSSLWSAEEKRKISKTRSKNKLMSGWA